MAIYWNCGGKTPRVYYTVTSDDRVEVQLDSKGNVQGFLIWGLSKVDSSVSVELPPQVLAEGG